MIIVLGVAGAGKSIQSELLAERIGCPWISIGSLLRQHADPTSQEMMQKGEMLPDSITLDILSSELERIGADKNEFVLDGFPRNLFQAEWLNGRISSGQLSFTGIIHLNISKEEAKRRLLMRGRADDHEEAIEERFSDYEQTILPILDFFRSGGLSVHEVDGQQPVESVQAQIMEVLKVADAS